MSGPSRGGPRRAASSLAERLRARIDADGPIPFAEFMEAALYDPDDGFFSRPAVGERGHFVTGPHVSAMFGILVARQVEDFWGLLGRPDPFMVVEAGAGDGTLTRQVLGSLGSSLREAVRYVAVERSEPSRRSLERTLGDDPRLTTAGSLDAVAPAGHGCVIANELLDNLPFHLVRRTEDGLVEILVGAAGSGFGFVEGPAPEDVVARSAPRLDVGQEAPARPAAMDLVEQAAGLFSRGYVWLVDYGSAKGRWAGPAHGYRDHRSTDDVLADPGSRDITAGVDFDALARHAHRLGLRVWGPVTQRDALLSLGFRELEERARTRQVEALAGHRGLEAMRIHSNRHRASLLVRRGGLGDFLVLAVGTGVDEPPRSMRSPVAR